MMKVAAEKQSRSHKGPLPGFYAVCKGLTPVPGWLYITVITLTRLFWFTAQTDREAGNWPSNDVLTSTLFPEAQGLKIQEFLNHVFDKHEKSYKVITILLEETFSNALIELGIMTWTWSYKPLISSALMTSWNKREEVSILVAETKNAQHTTTALISHAAMDNTEKTKTVESETTTYMLKIASAISDFKSCLKLLNSWAPINIERPT